MDHITNLEKTSGIIKLYGQIIEVYATLFAAKSKNIIKSIDFNLESYKNYFENEEM